MYYYILLPKEPLARPRLPRRLLHRRPPCPSARQSCDNISRVDAIGSGLQHLPALTTLQLNLTVRRPRALAVAAVPASARPAPRPRAPRDGAVAVAVACPLSPLSI